MDHTRKELQGPRPTPLKVRKESHKIKKPPVAPPPAAEHHQEPPQKPVIIYTVSPKVIHANPSEFMQLVQRLTGPDNYSTSSSSQASASSSTCFSFSSTDDCERTKMPLEDKRLTGSTRVDDVIIGDQGVERTVVFPGILSPGPGSLPQISPNLFPQFFYEPGNQNMQLQSPFATNNNFMVSPNTTFSPSSLDLLHHILNN